MMNVFLLIDLLSFKCSLNKFIFINQSSEWTLNNGALDSLLFHSDGLHLVKRGNLKLGRSILKVMDSVIIDPRITNLYKNAVCFTDFILNQKDFAILLCIASICNSVCNLGKPTFSKSILIDVSTSSVCPSKPVSASSACPGKPTKDNNIHPNKLVKANSVHEVKPNCGNFCSSESVITSNFRQSKPISISNVPSSKPVRLVLFKHKNHFITVVSVQLNPVVQLFVQANPFVLLFVQVNISPYKTVIVLVMIV